MSELDRLAYSGDDLGAVYTKEATTFKVWSPTAEKVQVLLYTTGSDKEPGSRYITAEDMSYDSTNGVWSAVVKGDLLNKYYTYLVYHDGKGRETVDIYAKAVGVNGNRGMVVDLPATDPEGWYYDRHITVDCQSKAIVWETSVKDFSNDPASGVSEKNRGKYLAFTESGTTVNSDGVMSSCMDYLRDLGVNYVQLMPIFDFGSVDEASSEDQFNWGYDPKNYNAPEGSFSSNPYDGNVRINECKRMIKAIHDNGMGVIMDVVFNHTYASVDSWFNLTVPNYYYRMNCYGSWSNGSGCGNDTASEHKMFRKYMVDSVVYWAKEYHIDGFRFDLMGLHDVETMNEIRKALDALDGGEQIIIYGEGWSLGTNPEPNTMLATQYNLYHMDTRIGAFNDGIRDGIKGGNFNANESAYIQGCGGADRVRAGIVAETMGSWAKLPTQTVTYSSCHDNYTLWDKLVATSGSSEDYTRRNEYLVAMNKLSAAIILTSQGVSFFLSGEEFARTKKGDENSYASSSKINQLDWNRRIEYDDLVSYYSGLIEIRKNFAPFTDGTKTSAETIAYIGGIDHNVIAYTIENKLTPDTQWSKVAVIVNPTAYEQEIPLGSSEWVVVANGEYAGVEGLSIVTNGLSVVKPKTAMILVDKASYDKVKLKPSKGRVVVNHIEYSTGEVIKKVVLSGAVGNRYSAAVDPTICSEYTFKRASGSVVGKYAVFAQEVNLYYTKQSGTTGTVNIRFVDAETGIELAPSVIQRGRTGSRYFTAKLPNISGYAVDLTSLPSNGSGIFTENEITVVYSYIPVKNQKITVHYFNSNNWENLRLYAYGESVSSSGRVVHVLGSWPGAEMKNDGDGWWSYTIPYEDLSEIDEVKVIVTDGQAQDPVYGEGYSVSGEVWIENGMVKDKTEKRLAYTGSVDFAFVDHKGCILEQYMYNTQHELSVASERKTRFSGVYTAEEIDVIFNYKPSPDSVLIVWLLGGCVAVMSGGISAFILRDSEAA